MPGEIWVYRNPSPYAGRCPGVEIGASITTQRRVPLRTFKRLALMGALTVAGVGASASAAQAITISPGSTAVTFTTGATQFNAAVTISCTGSTVTGTTPASGGNVGAIGLSFSGCNTQSGGVTCTGVTMSVDADGTWSATASDADVRVTLPANSCTIVSSTGCTIRTPRVSTSIFGDAYNNGAGAATIALNPTVLGYSASGGFPCFFLTQGTATFSDPNGNPAVYVQTGGTALTIS
jgi:hypothetical protein